MSSRGWWRLVLAGVLAGASGCYNALLFYETGKISLTLEGKPDDSQPVQGNLGYKQRTVLIAPPKQSDGNAPAMISSFNFSKEPGITGAVDVRTALVTGTATTNLSDGQKRRAAQAVAGLDPPSEDAVAVRAVRAAAAKGRSEDLKKLADKDFTALTKEEKAELGSITDQGKNYDAVSHEKIRRELGL